VLSADGTAELDAAIMDGTDLRAGAVAQLRHIRNPVQLARAVLEDGSQVFLVSDGAESFARQAGLALVDNDYFITPDRRQQFEALKLRQTQANSGVSTPLLSLDEPPLGTVGAVARDGAGRLAAATSTGGIAGKRSGRVGDSPVIGAGTYADNHTCAVSTTGHGEWFLRTVQAYDISARLRYGGYSLANAVSEAIVQRLSGLGAAGGLIAVDRLGEIVTRHNTPIMFRASVREGEAAAVDIY
jgi:beta-aspartyl-peptidase (threonine type)